MLDLLFIALFQAATADPAPAPEMPAAAAEQQRSDTAERQEETAQERARCRMEAPVGTRLAQRVCTTRRQDRQREDDSRDAINRAQSQIPLGSN